ncbi:MAG: SMP-30/gluconolactonase/LRE family protein [Gammaproteobacteria bacterium]
MKIIKIALGSIIALILVSVVGVWGYLRFSGDEPHFAGTCEVLELDGSAEDILIDRQRGFAYLSLMDRLALAEGETGDGPPKQGRIGHLDLNADRLRVEPALLDKPRHFRPHGMSFWYDDSGQRYLFVINHPVERGVEPELVELFREEAPGRYRHARTFAHELFSSPNDIVAVGPEQFYLANDSMSEPTKLIFVDGDDVRAVADDIASGGGINASSDGNMLYVAETQGQQIRVMRRNPADGSVETVDTIAVGTSPDNIDVAADGSLWVGAHSNVLALVMHFIAGANSPSQVLRIGLDGTPQIEEIYLNRGDEISASSVGATYEDKLLIGSITARKILICTMD